MLSIIEFPNTVKENVVKTSEQTFAYNCIAWAVGDTKRWWWPSGQSFGNEVYWPDRVPRDGSLKAMTKIFKDRGYKLRNKDDGSFQEGILKIAIYAIDNRPTHAAKQLHDGRWSHKIGANIDVTASLKAFEGPKYGNVVRIMGKETAS